MNSLEISTNSTTRFLLPILFPNTKYEELIANGFIQAYIGMLDDDTYDDSLLLLFHKDIDIEGLEELFIDKMDVDILDDLPDDTVQMIVINNWRDYLEDEEEYSKFLSGNWSKLSPYSKENILSFWGEDGTSMLYMILTKDSRFKSIVEDFTSTIFAGQLKEEEYKEYWPKPDIIDNELYFTGDL
jgi:hypothetical protein